MKPIDILLVEDNEGDILLIKEAMEDARVINTIRVAYDGAEAMHMLTDPSYVASKGLPQLILLDINLPKKSGHEVLTEIKETPDLEHIPVIVLTTSSSEADILKAYKRHASCFVTKPVDVDDFMHAITKIEMFWLQIVSLPKK